MRPVTYMYIKHSLVFQCNFKHFFCLLRLILWMLLLFSHMKASVNKIFVSRKETLSHCLKQGRSTWSVRKYALKKKVYRRNSVYTCLCTGIILKDCCFPSVIVHCSPDVSWWKGQNMRTKKVGMFPSELVESGLRRGTWTLLSPQLFLSIFLSHLFLSWCVILWLVLLHVQLLTTHALR